MFMLDTYAYKDHVEMRWDEPGEFEVSFEGGHRQVYDPAPAWIAIDPAIAGRSGPWVNRVSLR